MNKFKILLVCCLVHFLTGCNWYSNCPKLDLTKEELSWFDAYELGDVIVLESNKNNRDTLIVVDKTYSYSPCNKFELSLFQKGKFSIRLAPKHINDSIGTYPFMDQSFDKFDSITTTKLFNVYGFGFSSFRHKKENTRIKYQQIIVPYAKDSVNTLLFDSTNVYDKDEYILAFNWSKEYGLVKYETSQGEIFELISHKKGDALSDFIKKYKKDSAPQEIKREW